jgi:hypothetical protein
MPAYFTTACNTGTSIDSGAVSFYAPLLAFVIAVLAIPTMTTSSSPLLGTFSRLKVGFDESCEFNC